MFVSGSHDKSLDLDVSESYVYFYDFAHNETSVHRINEAAKGILSYNKLDKRKKFIIFVGGYRSNINKNTEQRIRDTFKNLPNSYLLILDHSLYTNDNLGNKKSYERSVQYAYYIGRALAIMLINLKEQGISAKNMHCIGHSLGSHILGNTGDIFYNITRDKIARITALDPAGPCYSNSLIEEQVRKGVADYVEIYHCNAGGLGSTSVLGDIDFFVNTGQFQPNCKTPLIPGIFDSSKAAKCSHKACVTIWTATVKNRQWFVASKCDSYKLYDGGLCKMNNVTLAGFWNPGKATGVYYFSTDGYDIN